MRWCAILFLFLAGGFAGAQTQPSDVTITVAQKPRQTFVAFGTSLTNFDGDFQKLPPAVRDRLSSAIWKDLDFMILRLWFSPAGFKKNGLDEFKRHYVDSGVIESAKKHGCTTLLLAPGDVPPEFAAPKANESDTFRWFSDDGVAQYAALLTEAITQLRDNGVPINAAGILNEPNDRPIRFTGKQWPVVVKTLRFLLDNRGLNNVAIVAPEAASGDQWAEQTFDAIAADPDAWAGLGGFATHSYNMAVTPTLLEKSHGKAYWQTESSTPGPEADDATAAMNAATTAARVLSDLNHGATHWLWFIGYEQTSANDNGVRLIRFDATKPDGDVHFSGKYYAMRQLSQTFGRNAVVYPCASSTENSMTYTYGRKPALLAAAAKNADGTWVIAVQNYTSDRFAGLKEADRQQAGPDVGRTMTVTVRLPALAGVDSVPFAVRRTNDQHPNADAGKVEMKKGQITLRLEPLELVTLRAMP